MKGVEWKGVEWSAQRICCFLFSLFTVADVGHCEILGRVVLSEMLYADSLNE